MFSAFAKFDNYDAAQKACEQVLSSTNGIVRIGTRMFVPPHAHDEHNPRTADAIAKTVAHSSAMAGTQWIVPNDVAMNAAEIEAEYDRRTGYERPRDCDYILCAQGSREAADHAAKIMRSMGGANVDVRDSRGSFLDGQPKIR